MNPRKNRAVLALAALVSLFLLSTSAWAQGFDPASVTETIADGDNVEITKTVHTPTIPPNADICFLAPSRSGDQLVATAQRRTQRGRSGIYDVTVTRGDQVVAEFRGRSRTLPEPSATAR